MHSETMGVYNLAKKRTTLLIIQMQCTLHSERLGVYNLARKIKTFSMHEKINYHGLLWVLMMEMQCTMKYWVHIYNLPKKGHDVTYDVNSVHSETMGDYSLAKKRTTF